MHAKTLHAMAIRHQPLQPLELTFVAGLDGFRALSALQANKVEGYVEFQDDLLALAVLSHQSWFNAARKLTMYFKGGLLWDEAGFQKIASGGIESIRVASDSPLNALQSGRSKKRAEACALITAAILTREVTTEITDWGLTINLAVTEVDSLYAVDITVEHNNERAFSICLDGWSGNILTPEMKIISFCPSLSVIRETFQRTLMKYLEEATA